MPVAFSSYRGARARAFDDDADRRAHWAGVFANVDFVEGEAKPLHAAPWGPHP
jgi:hypothetical protein